MAEKSRSYTMLFLLSLFSVYVLAFLMQAKLFLSWDVSWLLRASAMSVQGGTFTNDFFSPNPPAVLYFYRIPIYLSQWLAISLPSAFQVYMFILASLSLWMCYSLLVSVFQDQRAVVMRSTIGLAVTFLILPMYEIGQRDQLLYMLAMPYALLMVSRLQGRMVSRYFAIFIGLFAGLAFAMKPQFLMLPCVIELYYLVKSRNIFSWVRPEIAAISAIFLAFLALTLMYYPDYFSFVMPIILKNYYVSLSMPWKYLIVNPMTMFCLLPMVVYLVQRGQGAYQELVRVLLLSLVAYLLIYLTQRTLFFYHLIPPLSMAFFILIIQIELLIWSGPARSIWLMILPVIYILALYIYFNNLIQPILIFAPGLFFSFLAIIFIAYLGRLQGGFLATVLTVSAIVAVGVFVSFMVSRDSLFRHDLLFTLLSMSMMLAFFMPKTKNFVANYFIVIMAVLFLGYPVVRGTLTYSRGITYRTETLDKLIAFFKAHPDYKSMNVFAEDGLIDCPLIHYAPLVSTSRFDCLWLVGLLQKMRLTEGDVATRAYIRQQHGKDDVVAMIAEDLAVHKPDVILIDAKASNMKLDGQFYHFDYIDYFSENASFLKEWQHYRYVTTLTNGPLYQLKVYERF